jgi:hypothetical protein
VAKVFRPEVWADRLSAPRLQQVLRAGGLPASADAVDLLRAGLVGNANKPGIADRYPAWVVVAQQLSDRAMSTRLKLIASSAARLSALLADDPQQQLEAFLGSVLPKSISTDFALQQAFLAALGQIPSLHARVRAESPRKSVRRTEPEDWLFRELFELAAEIKGQPPRPGILFGRFVRGCAKLLDIDLRHLGEDALRRRFQRRIR